MAWLSTWVKRIKITVDSSKVDASLSNYPLPVYLSAASGIGDVDASRVFDELSSDANRKKIAVTTSDGTTQCYVEIESWDDANEKATLWVRTPSISDSADTVLYVYFDASQPDNTTYVGDTGDAAAQSVWAGIYDAVWHAAQDPSGGANSILESTSNEHDASPNGSMTSGDLVDGTIGKGLDFDGTNDYLSVPDDPQWYFPTNEFTVEVFFSADTIADNIAFLSQGRANIGDPYTYFNWNKNNSELRVQIDGAIIVGESWSPSTSTKYHVMFRREASNVWNIFVDGSQLGTNTTSATTLPSVSTTLDIGSFLFNGTRGAYLDGQIYEIRINNGSAVSDAWGKANYHGLNDTLVTLSDFEIATQTITETVVLSDTTVGFSLTQAISETVVLSDTTVGFSLTQAISETVVFSDTTQKNTEKTIEISDTLVLSDETTKNFEMTKTISDTVVLSDEASSKNPTAIYRKYPISGIKTAFECTLLSGRELFPDLPVPISSFAIRGQHPYGSGGWTGDRYEYVTVQIPGNDLAEQIQANGDWWEIRIEIVQYYGGEEIFREILTQTNFPPFEINYYENLTPVIEITGTSRVAIWDLTGWKTGEITMHNPVYRATKNGIKEYRFKHVDPYAKAGWYIYVGADDTTGFHCDKIDIEVTTTGINVVVHETRQDRGS